MNGFGEQLLRGPAEGRLPGAVELLEVAVEAAGGDQVVDQLEVAGALGEPRSRGLLLGDVAGDRRDARHPAASSRIGETVERDVDPRPSLRIRVGLAALDPPARAHPLPSSIGQLALLAGRHEDVERLRRPSPRRCSRRSRSAPRFQLVTIPSRPQPITASAVPPTIAASSRRSPARRPAAGADVADRRGEVDRDRDGLPVGRSGTAIGNSAARRGARPTSSRRSPIRRAFARSRGSARRSAPMATGRKRSRGQDRQSGRPTARRERVAEHPLGRRVEVRDPCRDSSSESRSPRSSASVDGSEELSLRSPARRSGPRVSRRLTHDHREHDQDQRPPRSAGASAAARGRCA